jgi:general secretion pathway protein K
MRRLRRQRGIALLAVLWTMLLLSLIAASFTALTKTEIRLARNTLADAKAEALADAGVHRAILGLFRTGFDEDTESGAVDMRVDGTVYAWGYDGGEIRLAIQDEGGKIDLNASPDNLLRGLFESVGLEPDAAAALSDAILDFRDVDELHRLNGAEGDEYSAAGLPYGPKNAAFETVEELRQVLGMTAELYDRVAPSLTVYSRRRLPFRLTSPPDVQAALAAALAIRTEGSLAPAEPADDDQPAQAPRTAFTQALEEEGINVRSPVNVFTIHAEARIAGQAVFARDAVVRLLDRGGLPYHFLAWRRARRLLFESGQEEPAVGLE